MNPSAASGPGPNRIASTSDLVGADALHWTTQNGTIEYRAYTAPDDPTLIVVERLGITSNTFGPYARTRHDFDVDPTRPVRFVDLADRPHDLGMPADVTTFAATAAA